MKLKCIGGYCDGKIQDIPDHYKYGDVWKIAAECAKFEASSFEEDLKAWRENRPPEYLSVKYHIYIIDNLKFASTQDSFNELKFLRPIELTTWDCILHLFQSHHNAT